MLTTEILDRLEPLERGYKVFDGKGLYAYVTPSKGTISFRLKYRFKGKEAVLVIGRYPEVSLDEARAARTKASQLLRRGLDPRTFAGKPGMETDLWAWSGSNSRSFSQAGSHSQAHHCRPRRRRDAAVKVLAGIQREDASKQTIHRPGPSHQAVDDPAAWQGRIRMGRRGRTL
jgi:hypothetical protein